MTAAIGLCNPGAENKCQGGVFPQAEMSNRGGEQGGNQIARHIRVSYSNAGTYIRTGESFHNSSTARA